MTRPRSAFGASPHGPERATSWPLGRRQRPGKAGSTASAWERLIPASKAALAATEN